MDSFSLFGSMKFLVGILLVKKLSRSFLFKREENFFVKRLFKSN